MIPPAHSPAVSEVNSEVVTFGVTKTGLEAQMRNNPHVQRIVDQMVKEKLEKQRPSLGRLVKSPSDTTIYAPSLMR